MRYFLQILTLSLLVGFLSPQSANAQRFLERLEGRINDAIDALSEDDTPLPPRPAPASGYLGLVADNDPANGSVRVVSVKEEGPAARAGIKAEDRLTSINGTKLEKVEQMVAILGKMSAGQKVTFGIARGDSRQQITATLAARPQRNAPPNPGDQIPPQGGAMLGVAITEITAEDQRRLNLPSRDGVLITEVGEGTPAARYQLPIDGVITSIDRLAVRSPEDLIAIVRSSRPGVDIEFNYIWRGRSYRKMVRLAPTGDFLAEEDPPLILKKGAQSPALNLLEKGFELGDVPPKIAPPKNAPPKDAPLNDAPSRSILTDSAEDQIKAMKSEIDRLQQRINQLEDQLAKEKATDKE